MKRRESAFIPPGLLPVFKDDPKEYNRVYQRLRKQYDPNFQKQINAAQRRRKARKKDEAVAL